MMRLSTMCLLPVVSATAGSFTASAMAGYGLPFPGSTMGSDQTSTTTNSGSSSEREVIFGSLADGIRAGVALGYELSPLARLDLGLRYEASSEIESKYDYNTPTMSDKDVSKTSVSQIAFVPSMVVAFSEEGVRPYVRVSGHFGFPTSVSEYSSISTSTLTTSGDVSTVRETEARGGIAWGFGGGVGIEFPLSGSMSAVGEVVADNWTWGPTESEVTKLTENGVDVLSELSESEKKTKYVDSYSTNSASPASPDAARKSLRTARTYSSLALNLGLQMRF